MLEELGVDAGPLSELAIKDNEDALGISLLSRSSKYFQQEHQVLLSNGGVKSIPGLSPQLANLMTTREMAAFVMLQLFGELAEKRIESWGRIARLIITQPMDGFATTEFSR